MFESYKETILGIKTFFVVPELSLIPEEYLKSFFMKGFETYFLDDDPYLSLQSKVRVLFSLFPELILFFNIDRRVSGIDWPVFIGELQNTYGQRAMIGVLYRQRNDINEVRDLERLYLYELGICCGCIPVKYQKSSNLFLLMNVLIANQANGRRKHLRVLCDDFCRVSLEWKGSLWQGQLRDISISHFSMVFIGNIPEIPMYEKISSVQLSLRGVLSRVSGVLCLKRVLAEEDVHVFVFRNGDDRDGLDAEALIRVNSFVFQSLHSSMNQLLRKGFQTERVCRLKPNSSSSEKVDKL